MDGASGRPGRIAVVVSGSGTTLQNLLDRIGRGEVPARVVLVVGSVEGAFGLERARKAGIPAVTVARKAFPDAPSFSEALTRVLDGAAPDLVLFGGFIHRWLLPPSYAGKVINVHPALVPAFSGKGYYYDRVHREALERGVKVSGCTVHFVDARFDEGPIILQRVVPVGDDDSVDSLRERVQAQEREAVPEAVRLFFEGRLRIEGKRVRILPPRG